MEALLKIVNILAAYGQWIIDKETPSPGRLPRRGWALTEQVKPPCSSLIIPEESGPRIYQPIPLEPLLDDGEVGIGQPPHRGAE